jgi:hypothetical protein
MQDALPRPPGTNVAYDAERAAQTIATAPESVSPVSKLLARKLLSFD